MITIIFDRIMLVNAVARLIEDVDYDIAKEYDPEYAGREDDEHETFEDVAEQFLRDLHTQGARVDGMPE